MSLPINNPPANMQEGLANYVALGFNAIERGDFEDAYCFLRNLHSDVVNNCYQVVDEKLEIPSPVPHYDPQEDGDYSDWLVRNNID